MYAPSIQDGCMSLSPQLQLVPASSQLAKFKKYSVAASATLKEATHQNFNPCIKPENQAGYVPEALYVSSRSNILNTIDRS
jgi:hypothetical protein